MLIVGANPHPTEEARNKIARSCSNLCAPKVSPGFPISIVPETQPTRAELTVHPCKAGVR